MDMRCLPEQVQGLGVTLITIALSAAMYRQRSARRSLASGQCSADCGCSGEDTRMFPVPSTNWNHAQTGKLPWFR